MKKMLLLINSARILFCLLLILLVFAVNLLISDFYVRIIGTLCIMGMAVFNEQIVSFLIPVLGVCLGICLPIVLLFVLKNTLANTPQTP